MTDTLLDRINSILSTSMPHIIGREAEAYWRPLLEEIRDRLSDKASMPTTLIDRAKWAASSPAIRGSSVEVVLNELIAALYASPPADELREALKPVAVSDKKRPIAIWHAGDAKAYYEATPEEQDAWNAYAQAEASDFDNDPRRDSYDSTAVFAGHDRDGKVTSWCPRLYFPEWLADFRRDRAALQNTSSP